MSPDIVVGGLRFYRHSSFFLSFFLLLLLRLRLLLLFVSCPMSSLNETRPKPARYSEVSAILKCMSEIWGIPSRQNGPKTTFFDDCAI